MAYKCLFMDSDVYTAQDVNDAISNIVSGGVSGYPFGSGAMADLNRAVTELANGGVGYKGTSCLVTKNGTTYKISEGVCIMNDGSQIIFDSNGYVLSVEPGVKQYVYLERDVMHNTINVIVSQNAGGQNTIPLAEIAANGNVTDRRRFATAKVSILAEPQNVSMVKRIRRTDLDGNNSIDIGFNGWKFLIYVHGSDLRVIELNDGQSKQSHYSNVAGGGYTMITRNGSVLSFTDISQLDLEIEVR